MRLSKILSAFVLLVVMVAATSCDHIDNKSVPGFTVHIDLGSVALWNTYGVHGMGDYQIFNREKGIPKNFAYNANTYTGFGGVLLMMGMETPMAYDMACPVESSQSVILSINAENLEAVCPRCNSHFNPLTGAGGPVSGVAINNKVGMRQYRVLPSAYGYVISN